MSADFSRRLALAAVFLASVAAVPAGDELRTELSLVGTTTSITYPSTLSAADPAHRAVFSAESGGPARVRVATLETNTQVRIGDISVGRRSQTTIAHDVWLEAAAGGWRLEIVETKDPAAKPSRVPLTRRDSPSSPQFVAALVPESGRRGRLILRWGNYEAGAEIAVVDSPRGQQPQQAAARQPNRVVNRAHDADNSTAARARLLGQRNETAVVLPGDRRLSVSYQQSFAKGEQGAAAAAAGAVRAAGLSAEGPDFARLSSTAAGTVVVLTQAAVPRLVIEAPLRFGATTIPIGNQVAGFPGAYGLWLKRATNGWRLVFNSEADVWGSQHNAKTDVAEIPLQYAEGQAASRPFSVALVPSGTDRGQLLIVWGPHQWSAEFLVSGS